ncbi:MAG: hypothetical protein IPK82_36880 [Polyangiaceae bacterium]|nr:hypothetical protein [Polyangiaceae bacterium]
MDLTHPTRLESAPALHSLVYKYLTLLSLRLSRERGEPPPEKAFFVRFAAQYPGALYELDRLPITGIQARIQGLKAALSGAPVEPWMYPMATYHALYRAALFIKRRSSKTRPLSTDERTRLAEIATKAAQIQVEISLVEHITKGTQGRIAPIVLQETARRHGQDPVSLLTSLFPTRKIFPTPSTAKPDSESEVHRVE